MTRMKLGQDRFVVRDANGQGPAYVYFRGGAGQTRGGEAPHTRDEARIAATAKLPKPAQADEIITRSDARHGAEAARLIPIALAAPIAGGTLARKPKSNLTEAGSLSLPPGQPTSDA